MNEVILMQIGIRNFDILTKILKNKFKKYYLLAKNILCLNGKVNPILYVMIWNRVITG